MVQPAAWRDYDLYCQWRSLIKNYLDIKMDHYNKYYTNTCAHAHTSTRHRQQMAASIGWVTTTEYHLRIRIAYTSHIWRIINF